MKYPAPFIAFLAALLPLLSYADDQGMNTVEQMRQQQQTMDSQNGGPGMNFIDQMREKQAEIQKKEKENAASPEGKLCKALKSRKLDMEYIKSLLAAGADVNKNIAPYSCDYPLLKAIKKRNVELARLFIESGAMAEYKITAGVKLNAMVEAASTKEDNTKILQLLIDSGMGNPAQTETMGSALYKPNDKTKSSEAMKKEFHITAQSLAGFTPLHSAVEKRGYANAAFLIEKGYPIDAASMGMTPLTTAVNIIDIKMVKLLVEGGADINLPGPGGYNAMDRAQLLLSSKSSMYKKKQTQIREIVDYLASKGARTNKFK